jgi:hypothetical protein
LERTAAATELHELLTDLGNPISELGLTMELRDFVVMVRFKTITLRCFGSQRGWTIRVLVEGAGQIAICELRSLRRTVWAIRAFGEFVSEEPEAVVRLARRIAWYSILLPH